MTDDVQKSIDVAKTSLDEIISGEGANAVGNFGQLEATLRHLIEAVELLAKQEKQASRAN